MSGLFDDLLAPSSNTGNTATAGTTGLFDDLLSPTVGQEEKDYSMLDNLPDWLKQGYNQSMTGLIQQAATGEVPFDLSGLQPSVARDFGAGLVSFFMPADLLTFVGTGGVGAIAAKKAGSSAFKQLIRGGTEKGLAKKLSEEGVKDIVEKAGMQAGFGGAGLAGMGGVTEALKQYVDEGEVDAGKVVKNAGKEFAIGAVTGGVGGALSAKGANLLTQAGAEAFTFGTLEPVTEGRLPNPQDYVQAGASILGIRGLAGVGKVGYRAATGQPLVQPTLPVSKPASKNLKLEQQKPYKNKEIRKEQIGLSKAGVQKEKIFKTRK